MKSRSPIHNKIHRTKSKPNQRKQSTTMLQILLLITLTTLSTGQRMSHHTAHSAPARKHKPKPNIHEHPGRSDPPRGHPVYWSKPPQSGMKGKWIGRVIYEWGYYDGEWNNGDWHGKGECHHDDDARTYVGDFKHHYMHGEGKMIYPDGHVVTGNWYRVHSWMINQGDGEIRWVDGRLYKGHWVNAQPHGIGVLTYPDGHEVQGSWDHGHCTNCDVQHAAMHKKEYRDHDEQHHLHQHVQHAHEEHTHLDLQDPKLQGKVRDGWKEYAHQDEM